MPPATAPTHHPRLHLLRRITGIVLMAWGVLTLLIIGAFALIICRHLPGAQQTTPHRPGWSEHGLQTLLPADKVEILHSATLRSELPHIYPDTSALTPHRCYEYIIRIPTDEALRQLHTALRSHTSLRESTPDTLPRTDLLTHFTTHYTPASTILIFDLFDACPYTPTHTNHILLLPTPHSPSLFYLLHAIR